MIVWSLWAVYRRRCCCLCYCYCYCCCCLLAAWLCVLCLWYAKCDIFSHLQALRLYECVGVVSHIHITHFLNVIWFVYWFFFISSHRNFDFSIKSHRITIYTLADGIYKKSVYMHFDGKLLRKKNVIEWISSDFFSSFSEQCVNDYWYQLWILSERSEIKKKKQKKNTNVIGVTHVHYQSQTDNVTFYYYYCFVHDEIRTHTYIQIHVDMVYQWSSTSSSWH